MKIFVKITVLYLLLLLAGCASQREVSVYKLDNKMQTVVFIQFDDTFFPYWKAKRCMKWINERNEINRDVMYFEKSYYVPVYVGEIFKSKYQKRIK